MNRQLQVSVVARHEGLDMLLGVTLDRDGLVRGVALQSEHPGRAELAHHHQHGRQAEADRRRAAAGALERAGRHFMVETADTTGHRSIGTAIMMAYLLGQRQGDILTLNWLHYKDGRFQFQQSKTARWIGRARPG